VAQVPVVAQMGLLGLAKEGEEDTRTQHLVRGVCPFRRRPATRQGEGRGAVGKEQTREHPGGEEQQDSPVLDPAQGPLLNVEVGIQTRIALELVTQNGLVNPQYRRGEGVVLCKLRRAKYPGGLSGKFHLPTEPFQPCPQEAVEFKVAMDLEIPGKAGKPALQMRAP
jgi:hypothetical protein